MLSEEALNEDDNPKHVSSTFRGVYKRKFDTKWRAEITAGIAHMLLSVHASRYISSVFMSVCLCMPPGMSAALLYLYVWLSI